MQLHGPTEPVDTIPVEPYGTSGSVALRLACGFYLVLTDAADADRLIIAAMQAKDLMHVTRPEDDTAPAPSFPHLPHLPQHQHGGPVCILCGIDHDAAARLDVTR